MHFSIVIPLYNKKAHIKRAIKSILQQTYQKFEIIVIDDGSTDNSYEEIKEIKDSRLSIYRKDNEGVSVARNFGVEKANNDYIAFLDADDVWHSLFLESILNLIREYPDAGAYASSYNFRTLNNIKKANININFHKGQAGLVDYFKSTLNDPLISASSVVIRKDVFDTIGGFMPDLTRGEDLEMWCRIALNYKIAYINKVLASYYLDSENKATDISPAYSKSFMFYAEGILEEQKRNGNDSIYFEEYMIRRILNKVRFLIEEKKYKDARKILYKYRYTEFYKKIWWKNFLLTFIPINFLYKSIKK